MGTIDRRASLNGGDIFRARVRVKGVPPQTASFTRKTDARKWVVDTEAAIRAGRYFATTEAKRHTLANLLDKYERDVLPTKPRNARTQLQQLQWWKAQLGAYRLADVTSARIGECRDRLLRTPTARGKRRSPATVVRYLAVLSHALSVGFREWEWLDDNPCRKVRKPTESRGRVRFLDEAERKRLLAACWESKSVLLYPIVLLAIATGMRKGEILTLRWPQVDFGRATVTLLVTKNGDQRVVPLGDRAVAVLRRLNETKSNDTALVFPNSQGRRPIEIAKAWTTALDRAEIPDFRFHDLRHTAASYLAQGGATGLDIAAVLGHRTLTMVKRYAHLSESRVRQVVADMNERALGGAGGGEPQ